MDTFKINIASTNGFHYVHTNRGKEYLFYFYKSTTSDNVWYFTVPEKNNGIMFTVSETVPVRFITELVRSVIILRYGIIDFDIEMTTRADRVLGIR
jgi:hypothetical protein